MDDLKSLYYVIKNLAGIELPWPGANITEIRQSKTKFDAVAVNNKSQTFF